MLASFAMFAFPKRLKSAKPTPRIHQPGRKHPSIRGNIFIRSLISSMCEKNQLIRSVNNIVLL